MKNLHASANPFLMMMSPEDILQAVERSERLNGLSRRVCRPLDKPLIPRCGAADLAAYDREIELDNSDIIDIVEEMAAE